MAGGEVEESVRGETEILLETKPVRSEDSPGGAVLGAPGVQPHESRPEGRDLIEAWDGFHQHTKVVRMNALRVVIVLSFWGEVVSCQRPLVLREKVPWGKGTPTGNRCNGRVGPGDDPGRGPKRSARSCEFPREFSWFLGWLPAVVDQGQQGPTRPGLQGRLGGEDLQASLWVDGE